MAGVLLVRYPVMENAAEAQADAATYVGKIEQARQDADLVPGTLGRILPSEEIVSGFRDATEATRASLEALRETCDALSETLEMVKEHFSQVDEAVADQFTRMLGA
jgi:Excreted virulence factor EspC, type VII ESX diderm